MCVVSMIGDHYSDKWKKPEYDRQFSHINEVSRAEFEALKNEVLEMKELLKKAIEYDKKNGEPSCENPNKVKLLKQIADLFGIPLDGLLDGLNPNPLSPPEPPPARIIKEDKPPRKPIKKK